MLQWTIGASVLDIMEDSMSLAEGPSFAVLSCQPNSNAVVGEAGESQCFGSRPVEGLLPRSHFLARLQQFFNFGMGMEFRRQFCLNLQQLRKLLSGHPGLDLLGRPLRSSGVLCPQPAALFLRRGLT